MECSPQAAPWGETSRYGTWLYGACEMDEYAPKLPEPPRCSARGCRELAVIELRWRNPKLHDAARVKLWHACADHADSLADFLHRRDFLIDRVSIGP
jgi:hypothetical protein